MPYKNVDRVPVFYIILHTSEYVVPNVDACTSFLKTSNDFIHNEIHLLRVNFVVFIP